MFPTNREMEMHESDSNKSDRPPTPVPKELLLEKRGLSSEEFLELHRRRLTEQVRSNVEKQLRWHYTWLGVIVSGFALLLLHLTVKDQLSEAHVALDAAQSVQDDATRRLLDATRETRELSIQTSEAVTAFERANESFEKRLTELFLEADSLRVTIDTLEGKGFSFNDKLEELSRDADLIRATIAKETVTTLQISSELAADMDGLNSAVISLTQQQELSEIERKALKKRLVAIGESLGKSAGTIQIASEAAEMRSYMVSISKGCDPFGSTAKELRERGFNIRMFQVAGLDNCGSLIVGNDMPFEVTRRFIAEACMLFDIDAIYTSDDYSRELSIGGFVIVKEESIFSKETIGQLLASEDEEEFREQMALFAGKGFHFDRTFDATP